MASICQNVSRVRIKAQLMDYIGQFQPGEPLPTFRSLMKTYKVSQSRLQSVLDELAEDGMVHRQPRKGIFCGKKSADSRLGTRVVELAYVKYGELPDIEVSPFFGDLVRIFAEKVSSAGRSVRLHGLEPDDLYHGCSELTQRPDVSAVVFLALRDPGLVHIFRSAHVRMLAMFPRFYPESYDCPRIVADPKTIEIQLEHLWSLGHTRIAMVQQRAPGTPNWVFGEWRERYYRRMAERGMLVQPCWVQDSGHYAKGLIGALNAMFSEQPLPTAVIAADSQLVTTYRFLESRGMRVGRDVSVIGTGDLSVAGELHPPATTIRGSRGKAVEIALEILNQMGHGESEVRTHYMPAELVVRQSTAPAAST